jgi:hypothetical protein
MSSRIWFRISALALVFTAAGCLQAASTGQDSGSEDAATPDGSSGPDAATGVDASTPDAGPTVVGSACTSPRLFGNGDAGTEDPCPSVGLVCSGAPGQMGTCQLPTTGEPCQATFGCAGNNACVPSPRGNGDVCAQTCMSTQDCPVLEDTCQMSGGQGSCQPDPCMDPLGTCNAAGTGDGTCLPSGRRGGGGGVCYQGGTASAAGPCVNSRTGGASEICAVNTFCVQDGQTSASACMPVCATGLADGGGACSNGDLCASVAVIELLRGSPDGGGGRTTGGPSVCLASCAATDAGTVPCPTGQVCVTVPIVGGSYCIP